MKKHVFAFALISALIACDRIGFLPAPAQRLVCLSGEGKAIFDGAVTDVSWSGDRVYFDDAKGARIVMHVPTTLCAVTPVPSPATPALPALPVSSAPPVSDAGPAPKAVDAGPAAK